MPTIVPALVYEAITRVFGYRPNFFTVFQSHERCNMRAISSVFRTCKQPDLSQIESPGAMRVRARANGRQSDAGPSLEGEKPGRSSQSGERRRSRQAEEQGESSQAGERRRSSQSGEQRQSDQVGGGRPNPSQQNRHPFDLFGASNSQTLPSIDRTMRAWIDAGANGRDVEDRMKIATAISKTIPNSSGKKANTKLDLSNKGLRDLPVSIRDSYCKYVNLSENHFSEIPRVVIDIINLTKLDLSKNEISEIPHELSKLINLEKLDLSSNKIKQLPETISQLAKLRSLRLNNNQIEVLYGFISKLTNLAELSVADNNLLALAPKIGDMSSLKDINLSNNPNLKRIPPRWEQLIIDVLNHFNLKNTGLQELPELEKHPENMKTLNLENNRDMRTLPKALGPMTLNRDPDKITTTKKGKKIDIYTRGTYLIHGLASEGRLQIKYGKRTVEPGMDLPSSLLHENTATDDDHGSRSVENVPFDGEPPINEAPERLVMDQEELIERWEDIKQSGNGPVGLIDLKRSVQRQGLVTIFAYTYGELQKLQGMRINVKEFVLAINIATAELLDLPLVGEFEEVGALMPLTQDHISEAIEAVRYLETVSDEDTNFAASQMKPLAEQGVSLVFTDKEMCDKAENIKKYYAHPDADQIKQFFKLAKGLFRQYLINKIAHIFVHLCESDAIDGAEASLVLQVKLSKDLELPGKINKIVLPEQLKDSVSPEEIKVIKKIVLTLEKIDGGALFKTYLGAKQFWREYVDELAEKLTVLKVNKRILDAEIRDIEDQDGWTEDYKKLGLGLFRQNKLNLLSYYQLFDREEYQAIDNPKVIALSYQVQLAEQLGLPKYLQEFPEEVAAIICRKSPPEKLERLTQAVLEFEKIDNGKLLEEFLDGQEFWREHQKAKARLAEMGEAVADGMEYVKKIIENLGIRFVG